MVKERSHNVLVLICIRGRIIFSTVSTWRDRRRFYNNFCDFTENYSWMLMEKIGLVQRTDIYLQLHIKIWICSRCFRPFLLRVQTNLLNIWIRKDWGRNHQTHWCHEAEIHSVNIITFPQLYSPVAENHPCIWWLLGHGSVNTHKCAH